MERAPSGAPRFDLMLLGVGGDGHVGSLYPAGRATDTSGAWVLPVVKAKPPASITLSLATMNAARSVIVSLGAWAGWRVGSLAGKQRQQDSGAGRTRVSCLPSQESILAQAARQEWWGSKCQVDGWEGRWPVVLTGLGRLAHLGLAGSAACRDGLYSEPKVPAFQPFPFP